MDWTTIITVVITALFGGGVGSFATFASTRQKHRADADSASVDAINKALDTVTRLQNEVGTLRDELAQKQNEASTKGYFLCVHMACPLRKPSIGRGKAWYDAHAQEQDLACDYTSIEDLYAIFKRKDFRQHGYSEKALQEQYESVKQ